MGPRGRGLGGERTAGPQPGGRWLAASTRTKPGVVLDRVLAPPRPPPLPCRRSEADNGAGWATEELPGEVRTAAGRLQRLATDAQRGASWYQRARTRGLVRLDLGQPDQLDLPRRYGPFNTHPPGLGLRQLIFPKAI